MRLMLRYVRHVKQNVFPFLRPRPGSVATKFMEVQRRALGSLAGRDKGSQKGRTAHTQNSSKSDV